ncbi:hypothetical protein ACJRO7_028786 [Eucalyptus globulus]|uniref:C2H2-type domain-containing protein n=1 Tax=Eucalyptus globulus TaxID=34317 RepID=A0ABD3JWD7_EUCGL
MEPSQEEAALGGPKEQTQIIVKGKRTKRQRPQSPILFVSTGSPMSSEGGDCVYNSESDKAADLSPSTSTKFPGGCTEEEEDMANCLILLAQGQSKEPSRRVVIQEDHDNSNKFTSKRYLEGYCVYECKTCNKTFPSFQALGGHRASHKKLKLATAAAEEKPPLYKQFMFLPSSPEQEEGEFKKVSTFSLGNINIYGSNSNCKKQAKIHECSICGTEFTSGQALGGHMRRHRPPVAVGVKLESDDESTRLSANGLLSLDLDLNLPAPEEENRDHLFLLSSKQQHHHQKQSHAPIFVSGPAVVDCHY